MATLTVILNPFNPNEKTVKTINPTNNYTKEELLSLCASCEKISSHPIAISIINEATKQKLNLKTTTDNQ